ncbi:MAG: NUDIX domain-containing protein [Aureispira sp.]|nr:NUDIX domain-containing protein [Aureispira sp.]
MSIPLGLKKVAAMCILRHGDELLLLKRANEPNKGKYLPVGGKLDPFESPRKAVIRETLEEAGVTIENPKFCGTLIESAPNNYNWLSYIYIADIDRITPAPCDEGVLEWIPKSELLNIPTPATDRYIYKQVLNDQTFAFSAEYNDQLELVEMMEEISNTSMLR